MYLLQRQDVGKLKSSIVSFRIWHLPVGQSAPQLENRSSTIFNIDEFNKYSDGDIYNALVYLFDSGLIFYNDSQENTGSNLMNLRVTSDGVDMVENIDKGSEEKRQFNITFNFNITNEMTFESLLKAEFGSIFKASLLG